MKVIDPTRVYGYLTKARGRVHDWIRPLSDDQWRREFPIGAGSMPAILMHTLVAEWYYCFRMLGREVPPIEELIERSKSTPSFADFERQWTEQAEQTFATINEVADWDTSMTYEIKNDETGRVRRVTTTPTDLVTQLCLHEMHHRAQVLNILRQLGVKTEDIDFGLMTFDMVEV